MADLTRRWIWIERLLFAGSLLLLLVAGAVLGLNGSGFPARWAEEALAAAFPGVQVDLGSVRLTGPGSLEATALRLDLDADGHPDFRSDRISLRFHLLRWLQERDVLAAVDSMTVRGVHARLRLPEKTAPRSPGRVTSGSPAQARLPHPVAGVRGVLARLPMGIHLRLEEVDLTLADGSGEIARLEGEAEVVRRSGRSGDLVQVSLAAAEMSEGRLGAELEVPLDPAGPWAGEVYVTTGLEAPWVARLLEGAGGWSRGLRMTGTLGLDGTLSGRGALPTVEADLRAASVTLQTAGARYRFDTVAGRLEWGASGLRLVSLQAADGPGLLTASGRLSVSGPDLEVRGERLELTRYAPLLRGYLEGETSLLGRVSGAWGEPLLEGTLSVREPLLLGGEMESLQAEVAWTGGELRVIRARAGAGEGVLEGEGRWFPEGSPGGSLEARVRAEGFAVQTLPLARGMGLGGRVDGELGLKGPVTDLAVSGRASSRRLLVGPARFQEVEALLGGTWGRIHIRQLTARREGGGDYRITGWIGPEVEGARPSGTPRIDLDVEATNESLPEVAALLGYELPSYLLTGRFDGRARVEGALSNPTGSARLELQESPLLGEDLVTQLDLRFGDGSVRVERVRRHPLRTGLETWEPRSDRA